MEKLKIAPELSDIIVQFDDEDGKRDEVRVPVTSAVRPDRLLYVGTGKVKQLSYA
jgi:hypothetical protein